MLDDLVINPSTKKLLEAYIAQPPQALLLTGPPEIGKSQIARSWAKLITSPENVQFLTTSEDIGIDDIRSLYRSTRNKQANRQVVIIDNAQSMGVEAQNALLKLLEEPRARLHFILLATNSDNLLSTITSRTQKLNILPVSQRMLNDFIISKDPTMPETAIKQILFIANGRPAMVAKILKNAEFKDEKFSIMTKAKQILTSSAYQRLILINELSSDRRRVQEVLEALTVMIYWQLKTGSAENINLHIMRLLKLEAALTKINNNGNLKCQLLSAFASLDRL